MCVFSEILWEQIAVCTNNQIVCIDDVDFDTYKVYIVGGYLFNLFVRITLCVFNTRWYLLTSC